MVVKFVSRCARKGVDPHPGSHTAVALGANGKRLGCITVANEAKGIAELGCWLRDYSVEVCAIEGANNPFARGLSQSLLEQGYKLVDVSPSLTSQYRSKRGHKKSDEVDAENVARAALANPELVCFEPQVQVEE